MRTTLFTVRPFVVAWHGVPVYSSAFKPEIGSAFSVEGYHDKEKERAPALKHMEPLQEPVRQCLIKGGHMQRFENGHT